MKTQSFRFEHDDMTLWYGTADAPILAEITSNQLGDLPQKVRVELQIGVQPADANNKVEVYYRVNGNDTIMANAPFFRNSTNGEVQYFKMVWTNLKMKDRVEYMVICRCLDKQVPAPEVQEFNGSFEITSDFLAGKIPSKTEKETEEQQEKETPNPTPNRIAATENQEEPFVVFGTVYDHTQKPMGGIRVIAYDKDMRSEQRLGQAVTEEKKGSYEIRYFPTQSSQAEQGTPDLWTKAYDPEGVLRATSEIIFNARKREQVDLFLEEMESVKSEPLTEFELLLQCLEPVQEGIEPRDFTEQDLYFLENELLACKQFSVTKNILRQRLEYLVLGDQLAQESMIPIAAFYGWKRLNLDFSNLKELSVYPTSLLLKELQAAIQAHIIPDILAEFPGLDETIKGLPHLTGHFVRYTYSAQLLEKETEIPLVEYTVIVSRSTRENEEERTLVLTDGQGIFQIDYFFPEDAKPGQERQLSFEIKDENEKVVAQIKRLVHPVHQPTEVIYVELPDTDENAIPVNKVVSSRLTKKLHSLNLHTLDDVLKHPNKVQELGKGKEVQKLIDHARWNVFVKDFEQQKVLIDNGFGSVFGVAKISKATFLEKMAEPLKGEIIATQIFEQAKVYTGSIVSAGANLKFGESSGGFGSGGSLEVNPTGGNGNQPTPTGGNGNTNSGNNGNGSSNGNSQSRRGKRKCNCEDCMSGVSVLAYYTDLLSYVLDTVQTKIGNEEEPISLDFLNKVLCHPFADLPKDCKSVNEKVNKVRVSIEVLRRFDNVVFTAAASPSTAYEQTYRKYLVAAYTTILNLLGTSFEELRDIQPRGNTYTPEELEETRLKTVADKLGITPEKLPEIFFDIEADPLLITEEKLEEIFGLQSTLRDPFQAANEPLLLTWQKEKLKDIWFLQDHPQNEKYGESRTIPFLEPYHIDQSYIRKFKTNSENFDTLSQLLEDRWNLIESFRQNIQQSIIDADALANVINNEFGVTLEELRTWEQAIQEGRDIEETYAAIRGIFLTADSFYRLMELTTLLEEATNFNHTIQQERIQKWVDILAAAFKRRQYSDWVLEERRLSLERRPLNLLSRRLNTLSAKFFQIPAKDLASPPKWLATKEDREVWEETYQMHNRRPIIEPDDLEVKDFYMGIVRQFLVGFNPNTSQSKPINIWHDRVQWKERRRTAFREAKDAAVTDLEKLNAILEEIDDCIVWNISFFEDLKQQEAEGKSIQRSLEENLLDYPRYKFFVKLIEKITIAERQVREEEWENLIAITTQAEKQLRYAQWNLQEQTQSVSRRPFYFKVADYNPLTSKKSQDRWLKNIPAYIDFRDTVKAREDQLKTMEDALKEMIRKTEELTLPILREAMIKEKSLAASSYENARKYLEEVLLINLQVSACQMTTRLSEAIQSLQKFMRVLSKDIIKNNQKSVWSFRINDGLILNFSGFIVDRDFDQQWRWMGSYAAWRAIMFIYVFPENYCGDPTLRIKSSQVFNSMVLKRLQPPVTPEKACSAAQYYFDYFSEITNLEVQACCEIKTTISVTDDEDCSKNTKDVSLMHVYALCKTKRIVYRAAYEPSKNEETMSSWIKDLPFENVEQIIGATFHETPLEEKYILIFVKAVVNKRYVLQFVRYNLKTPRGRWSDVMTLDLPPGAESDFQAVVIQKKFSNLNNSPTFVLFRVSNGRIIGREINSAANDWDGNWGVIVGTGIGRKYIKLCAVVERNFSEFILILEYYHERSKEYKLSYRILHSPIYQGKDDGRFRHLGTGKFAGAFFWFQNFTSVYVFAKASDRLNLYRVSNLLPTKEFIAESILSFDIWLKEVFGVDLRQKLIPMFRFEDSNAFKHDERDYDILSYMIDSENLITLLHSHGYSINSIMSFLKDLYIEEYGYEFNVKYANSLGFINFLRANRQQELIEFWARRIFNSFISATKKIVSDYIPNSTFDLGGDRKIVDTYFKDLIINPSSNPVSFVEELFDENYPKYFRHRGDYSKRSSETESKKISYNRHDDFVVVPKSGEAFSNTRNYFIINSNKEAIAAEIVSSENDTLEFKERNRITMYDSRIKKPSSTPLNNSEALQNKRATLSSFYPKYINDPPANLTYLYEAYHGVPILLASLLMRNGFYEDALKWGCEVYSIWENSNNRKIDYWLYHNSTYPYLHYGRQSDWLENALDPHTIATGRRHTYTSAVLQMMIRCLIQWGNRLFTIDNAETNPRALELYEKALELFNAPELRFSSDDECNNYLGSFEIEIEQDLQFVVQNLKGTLLGNFDIDGLESIFSEWRLINNNNSLSVFEKADQMQITVIEGIKKQAPPERIGGLLKRQNDNLKETELMVLSQPQSNRLLRSNLKKTGDVTLRRLEMESDSLTIDGNTTTTIGNPQNTPRIGGVNANNSIISSGTREIQPTPPGDTQGDGVPHYFFSNLIKFEFCVPQNPKLRALYREVTTNIFKLNNCMNIAGMKRELEPYAGPIDSESGMPYIGEGGQWVLPGVLNERYFNLQPTLYRFQFLSERAKVLVSHAQQIEAALLLTLEKRDSEALQLLQTRQSIGVAEQTLRLQDLRVKEALQGVTLSNLQQDRSQLQMSFYQGLLDQGLLESEKKSLDLLKYSKNLQASAAAFQYTAYALLQAAVPLNSVAETTKGEFGAGLKNQADAFSTLASALSSTAGALSTEASIYSTKASYERRTQEWTFQKSMAEQDMIIGEQQIQIANTQVQVVQQERVITELDLENAKELLHFLENKTTSFSLYNWMADILQGSYNTLLQMATATARLAETQLGFERQEPPPAIIQTDYSEMPGYSGTGAEDLGLTGSTRLLTDIEKLEQYAIDTNKRKSHLMIRLSLSQFFPLEFQQFKETGVMTFGTTLQMIEERFPGAYLCLNNSVMLSVVALTDPIEGIKANLTSSGVSRTVIGKDNFFQTITINRMPEVVIFSGGAIDNPGILDLQPQQLEMLNPFEGTGFASLWQLNMPKTSNYFNFDSIADVIVTFKCTALYSIDYQQQVLQSRNREVSLNRTFSFKNQFADQWYDLHHANLSSDPMRVRFRTGRVDFPSTVNNIRIQQVTMYFVKNDGAKIEVPVKSLQFTQDEAFGPVGGPAVSIDGLISTRFGSGMSWISMIGLVPTGEWLFDLSGDLDGIEGYLGDGTLLDGLKVQDLFEKKQIKDILFVITYSGRRG